MSSSSIATASIANFTMSNTIKSSHPQIKFEIIYSNLTKEITHNVTKFPNNKLTFYPPSEHEHPSIEITQHIETICRILKEMVSVGRPLIAPARGGGRCRPMHRIIESSESERLLQSSY